MFCLMLKIYKSKRTKKFNFNTKIKIIQLKIIKNAIKYNKIQ